MPGLAANYDTRPGISLIAPEVQSNPLPTYKVLRENYPVCQLEPDGTWAISRFDDVQFALKRHDLFSSSAFRSYSQPDWIKDECKRDLFFVTEDPPIHTKHHALANKAFVKRVIDGYIPLMQKTAKTLVNNMRQQKQSEFVQDFAYPYSSKIIAQLTGVDEHQNLKELAEWIDIVGESANKLTPPDTKYIATLEAAITKQNSYFNAVIKDRRDNPRDDFVSTLVHAEVDGEKLSDHMLRNALDLLIGSGFHTIVQLLNMSIIRFSRMPEIVRQLQTSPDLIPAFIEEMLRYCSPALCVFRQTTQAVTLNGVTIPSDTLVLVLITAANHDPQHFPNPDSFDISRKENRNHVAFGYGPHTCIGAALARLQAKVALETLLTNFKYFDCPQDDELSWINSIMTYGVHALPVSFK